MGGGAVALVLGELIVGEDGVECKHEAVALDFGDDASGGDGKAEAVAADDGLLGPGEILDGESVDEDHVRGRGAEGGDGAAHGEVGGAEDIELVDFAGAGLAGGEAHVGVVGEGFVEVFALGAAEFFGVVEEGEVEVFGQEDGGGEHGTGEGAAAGFVDAGDEAAALEAVGCFVVEGGHGAGKGGKEKPHALRGTCGWEKRGRSVVGF